MPDDVARAVGAGSSRTITVDGKECELMPLGVRELMVLERDCLDRYKRHYLETFSANLDLLPESQRASLMMNKMEEVARWDVDDLPSKEAFDGSRVLLTDKLREWLISYWGLESTDVDDVRLQRLTAAALDQDALSKEKYQQFTDRLPPGVQVSYIDWWTTGAYDGMISMLWVNFKRYGVSRDKIIDEFGANLAKLSEKAREIDRLSAPAVGNG